MNWKQSTRDIVIKKRNDSAGKGSKTPLRSFRGFAGEHFGDDPHEGTVRAIQSHSIGNQIDLCPVFARHSTIVRPIPVENQLTGFPLEMT
jgi:hypothetical protein